MARRDTTKYHSSKQEQSIAFELNWDVVSGSGARPHTPGDVVSDDWLGECKTHMQPGNPIQFMADHWTKISAEAQARHRAPVLFADDGSQRVSKTWVACRKLRIPLSEVLLVPFNKVIRKNISFNHEEATKYLNEQLAVNNFPHLHYVMFEAEWLGEHMVIMPFESYKELYNA